MTQINLLPWREEIKREFVLKFILLISLFVLLTLIIFGIIHIYLAHALSSESSRIQFLQSELKYESDKVDTVNISVDKYEKNINEIKELISLRNNNFKTIKLIDQIPRLLPKSISLTKLSKKDKEIRITGKAYSNSDITLFIKNISNTKGFSQANLTDITESTANTQEKVFEIYFRESTT